ncbi:hypothetical protein G6011_06065 [Alternaria panax]|uniref:Uncharacterized protein n=1 Tax=Alternaria panax TaxID=48097 RepID=A0AAD4FG39_9PLEO|nr:hypothetical protein G6011_06065 [Alternaria panax]
MSIADDQSLIETDMQEAFRLIYAELTLANKNILKRDGYENVLIAKLSGNNIPLTRSLHRNMRSYNANPATEDFTFMCDLLKSSKNEIVEGKRYAYLKEYSVKYHVHRDSAMKTCQATNLNLAFTSIVFRSSNPNAPLWNTLVDQPQRILLCRWVIEHWKHAAHKSWTGFYGSTWRYKGAKMLISPLKWTGYPFAQVDVFSLFDKLLVHEMTDLVSAGDSLDITLRLSYFQVSLPNRDPTGIEAPPPNLWGKVYGWIPTLWYDVGPRREHEPNLVAARMLVDGHLHRVLENERIVAKSDPVVDNKDDEIADWHGLNQTEYEEAMSIFLNAAHQ